MTVWRVVKVFYLFMVVTLLCGCTPILNKSVQPTSTPSTEPPPTPTATPTSTPTETPILTPTPESTTTPSQTEVFAPSFTPEAMKPTVTPTEALIFPGFKGINADKKSYQAALKAPETRDIGMYQVKELTSISVIGFHPAFLGYKWDEKLTIYFPQPDKSELTSALTTFISPTDVKEYDLFSSSGMKHDVITILPSFPNTSIVVRSTRILSLILLSSGASGASPKLQEELMPDFLSEKQNI